MPTYFQRPENALNRAKEFIGVGKKQRALDALYDVIKSKKHRTWQKTHEQIMEKYLELCVELRKSHVAKEGLYQYKNICQQVNIQSLVEVVRKYVALAEEKTEAARQESHQVVVDIDDLDVPDTPESLLLKAVSGEDTQDRTDRAILTPWVKFLWESYRQCLDLLRNNSRVERLYQDIAQQAFYFCLKYGRKTEFRKLCDNLRTHLGHVNKHQHQQTAINLNNAESQQMHLETRLVQLDSAINMELWQEAFKAVEDIHGLINLSKKSPKPALMANYYQKLSLVFWKSGNHLFHACTLHRLFHLSREQKKNISQDELQRMASKVLCATLAVPIPPARNSIDALLEQEESAAEKQRRLATLLMLQSPPTRQGMIKDLVKYNLIQYVHPDLQTLYRCLEVDFHPLRLFSRVASSVEFISKKDDLNQYESALEDIIITRVLKQVSQVYQTISFARFCSLVPFASHFHLERVIVDAAKTLELQVRVDHRTKSLSFGTDLGLAQKEDVPEGPCIQNMPSEQIRNQLVGIADALHKAVEILDPKEKWVAHEELKAQIFNSYKMSAKKEHSRILQRRHIIEDRKEQLELMNEEREREEMTQQEEQRKKAYDAEMARLEREAKERERQRQMEEHKEIQRKHARERIEQLKKTELGAKVLQNIDEEDFAELDIDDIMQKQVEQLEKEKKELHEKLKSQEKKIDHFIRAKRQEEIPLLQKQYEEERVRMRELFEQQENERIENLKSERELALRTKERLMRIVDDKEKFLKQLQTDRRSDYKDKLKAFEIHLAKERERRLLERKERRKEERRLKWIKDKEEAAQKKRDEALLRERMEKERLEQEERDNEEKVFQERMRKLDEQAAKQKQREKEIEEREMKRKDEDRTRERRDDDSMDRPRRPPMESSDRWRSDERDGSAEKGSSWRGSDGSPEKKAWRPSGGESGWRAREKERDDRWKRPERPEGRSDRWGRGPPQDSSDGPDRWSRGPPPDSERVNDSPREDFPKRSEREPPRDNYRERGFRDREEFRDRPPRDDHRDQQRGPREDFRDRAPRDDQDERGHREYPDRERGFRDMGRENERGQRGDFRDRERGPRDDFLDRERGPRDDFRDRERGPRDDFRDRERGFRDDLPDRGPPRDEGAWRRGGGADSWSDKDRSRDSDFDRRSRWQREERDGPDRGAWGRRGEDRERGGGSEWRRGGDDRSDRSERSERRLPERTGGGGFEREWRRGEDRDRDRQEPSRGDGGSAWRRGGPGGPPEGRPSPGENKDGRPSWRDKSSREEESKPREEEGDGWTTVRY